MTEWCFQKSQFLHETCIFCKLWFFVFKVWFNQSIQFNSIQTLYFLLLEIRITIRHTYYTCTNSKHTRLYKHKIKTIEIPDGLVNSQQIVLPIRTIHTTRQYSFKYWDCCVSAFHHLCRNENTEKTETDRTIWRMNAYPC